MFPLRPLLLAVSIATLFGCAATDEHTARAQALTSNQLSLDATTNSALWPKSDWWAGYSDPQLTQLIELAQTGNPSLRIAQARVELASRAAQGTRAVNQLGIDLNADGQRERYSENDIYPPPLAGSVQNHSRIALDFSYEFDFWGKQRATLEAALTEIDVANADRSTAQMVLSIAVAQSYYALQHALVEHELALQLAQQREALFGLMQMRMQRGLASGADVDPVQAAATNARLDVERAQQRIETEKHQLAALCGISPDQLPTLAPINTDALDMASPKTVPADLLGRRADIAAQRLRVETEAKHIAAAKADFYPNIDLTGFFGLQSVRTGELFTSGSRSWGAGPALHLPLFNRDALRAQLGANYASYDIAVEQYNRSVLDAVRETADAGAALQSTAAQRAAATAARTALQRARDSAELRYQRGLANRTEFINADIALLNQQRELNAVSDAQMQAQLALIKALGGGYDAAATAKN